MSNDNDSNITPTNGEQDPASSPKDELAQEIIQLRKQGMDKKAIANKKGIDVKRVRRILKAAGIEETEKPLDGSKLDAFRDAIRERVEKDMTATVIFREIGPLGYAGSITILRDFIRQIRGPKKQKVKAFRRFETDPAQEAQVDWSPYRVTIAGVECVVQCFAMVLAWSRYLFVQFHRDQKLPSLLAAHVAAFQAMGGPASRIVYDNMATITLGRRRREPIWNPKFLEFARHWMFEPHLCRPADPNRKGKIERPFDYLGSSLLQGRTFASWAELDAAAAHWLANVANCRVHGTTRAVPAERWQHERTLLTAPPESPFPTYREELRTVQRDCTISVGGHLYSVPADLVRNTVSVRVHPRHVEILDARGVLRARHAVPDRPGAVVIDKAHYATIRREPIVSAGAVEQRLLTAFPGCEAFLDGLKTRMKGLWRIHANQLERLVSIYGLDNTRDAIVQAISFRNYNANAIERILARAHPLLSVQVESTAHSLQANPEALLDIDGGSLADYRDVLARDPGAMGANATSAGDDASSADADGNSVTSGKEDDDHDAQGLLFPIAK